MACSMWRGSPGAPTFIVFYSVYILQAELLPGADRSIFPVDCMDRTYPFLATVWLQAHSQLSKDDPQPLQVLMDKLVLSIPLPPPPFISPVMAEQSRNDLDIKQGLGYRE